MNISNGLTGRYTEGIAQRMGGNELRELRHRLGLTQAELAEKLGVAPNTVARWERDEKPISQLTENFVKLLERTEQQTRRKK